MLRVGIDITPLVGPPTGIHQHTRHLTDALLARDDIAVSGWLLSARGDKPHFPGPIRRSPIPAAPAARLWARGSWPGRRTIAGPVDVVHGVNFLAPPTGTSVVTIQDLTPLAHPDLIEPAVAAKAPAIRRIIDSDVWIHTSSQAVANELADLGRTERVRVIHHGLRLPTPTEPGTGIKVAGFERYVLVLGTTERRKRVPAIVAAMTAVDNEIGLVIAGPVGNDEPAVDRAIADAGLGDRVQRLTTVDDATRDALVHDAAVLALAAEYEGFGFTPLEAAAVGTAVVATAVGALPELIGDLLDLANPSDLNLGPLLAAACEDPTVPAAVTGRLRGLTWTAHADAMIELYQLAANS